MGREVRRVPAGWQHPKDDQGRYVPMFDGGGQEAQFEWDRGAVLFAQGFVVNYKGEVEPKPETSESWEEWEGERPNLRNYMPDWSDAEKTHVMMYENTSEGTPISPAFESPEQLAQWLVDNKASAFGDSTASYEGWLRVAHGGFAPSFVIRDGMGSSGVDGK